MAIPVTAVVLYVDDIIHGLYKVDFINIRVGFFENYLKMCFANSKYFIAMALLQNEIGVLTSIK